MEVEAERPRAGASEPDRGQAERAVDLLEEMSAGLRGCAILDRADRPLAASGELRIWGDSASGFLSAADAARPGVRAEYVHVATEDGDAFGVRHDHLSMVAVTDRFPLASLVASDMRAVLRDLAAGEIVDRRAPGRGVAADEVDPEAAAPPAD